MEKSITVNCVCPTCGASNDIEMTMDTLSLAPELLSGKLPVGMRYIYKFTSEDIAKFLLDRAREAVPGIKLEFHTLYCESKRRRKDEPRHSYASLRVAFSDASIEGKNDAGWFTNIGDEHATVKKSLFEEIIERYKYDPKKVKSWLKEYDTMEELEERRGMTEPFIMDIKEYLYPKKVEAKDGSTWVFISLAPEYIINHMMETVNANESGSYRIADVHPISKTSVEFVVMFDPSRMEMKENPHVRQILEGSTKNNK